MPRPRPRPRGAPPAAQLAPVVAELTGAVLPVADVPEAAGALRMVAKLTEAVPRRTFSLLLPTPPPPQAQDERFE